ncbi:MAG: hypothetical protein ACYTAF_06025 [Planctomycetota bacterium]|jgi:hypothetical protein
MLLPDDRNSLQTRPLILTIIHVALLLSIVLYVVVAFVVRMERPLADQGPDHVVFYCLVGSAILSAFAGIVLRLILASPRRLASAGGTREAFGRWMNAVIVSDALFECVTIFGLTLALISGNGMEVLPFAAVSVLLMLVFWPRLGAFKEGLEEGSRMTRQGG